jgi:hypothetical protein
MNMCQQIYSYYETSNKKHVLDGRLTNDAWQKDEILAAKLENFLTTV